jgi:hypothetical protein
MVVGVGTGLVAYYMGYPTSALQSAGGPEELRFCPRNATLVAFANVNEIMTSRLRERLRQALPDQPDGQREFQDRTGINIETDIDRVVGCVSPEKGMVLARGRFDSVKIESLMREHGALVEDYKGVRMVVLDPPAAANRNDVPFGSEGLTVAFIESGLAALGSSMLVRSAVDLKAGGDNVTANEELMNLVSSLESGNAWAVGRFDALTSQTRLPAEIAGRLPPITWFSASGQVNGGLSGILRAETRDEASATDLRDVIRGFLALVKMQAGSNAALNSMVQSLQLGGTGKTVALSFDIPEAVFDVISAARGGSQRQLQ